MLCVLADIRNMFTIWQMLYGGTGIEADIENHKIICKTQHKVYKRSITHDSVYEDCTLTRQKDRYVCHMLYASPVKRGNGIEVIEDIVPVYDTEITVKTDRKINRVYLAPQQEEIPFEYKDGSVSVKIRRFECHQMLVLE